jgi:hypothetical protein
MQPVINLVTSFPLKAWDLYAKEFLTSFDEKWDKKIHLSVYYDGGKLPKDKVKSSRISYFKLEKDKEWEEWQDTYGDNQGRPEGYQLTKEETEEWPPKTFVQSDVYNYRSDAKRFSHKVFALTGEARRLSHKEHTTIIKAGGNPNVDSNIGHLVWIDADSKTKHKITFDDAVEMIIKGDNIQETDICHLGRTAIDYSCTSFICFNLNSIRVHEFLNDFRGLYVSGELFGYREWTDAFVFTRLLTMYTVHGLSVCNLSEGCDHLEAFNYAEIGKYMVHLKGNQKITGDLPPDVSGPQRYALLPEMMKHYKTQNLLEVGTWSGARAVKMAAGAFEAGVERFHYTGFDLFEDATPEDDEAEKNVKRHYSEEDVKGYLFNFAETAAKNGKVFTYCIIKGNTRETLKILKNKDYCNTHNIHPTFAFIDGGHSVETIRSDYAALKHLPVVVMDDFYTPDPSGKLGLDIAEFGCNEIFDKDIDEDVTKAVIPTGDGIKDGGVTNLAIIVSDKRLTLPPNVFSGRMPIKVLPQDCMPKEHIRNNIETNTKKIERWIDEKGYINDEHVIIVSGGPSLVKYIDEIKEKQKKYDAKISCVKHSLPLLLENGIVPFSCTILDPRSIEGISTHGVIRKSLFENIPKETIMFIASMTDTTVLDYIMKRTKNIIGFHAFSQAVSQYEFLKGKALITGGTCAATRSVGVFHTLGFRNFHLYGFDSSFLERPENYKEVHEDGRPKFFKVGIQTDYISGKEQEEDDDDPRFWTTGELLALAQDMEQMLDSNEIDLNLEINCDGLVNAVWEDRVKKGYIKRTYKEILNDENQKKN